MNSSRMSAKASSKLYRRKLQKRLMHHKAHSDLQHAKNIVVSHMEKSAGGAALTPMEAEVLMKVKEHVFKKQIKQQHSPKVWVRTVFLSPLCLFSWHSALQQRALYMHNLSSLLQNIM